MTKSSLLALLVSLSVATMVFGQADQGPPPGGPDGGPPPAGGPGGGRGRGRGPTDAQRHFGDAPDDAGPLATDVSADLKPDAIKAAMKKVADWQLPLINGQMNFEWVFGPLLTGFIDASKVTGDAKYQDCVMDFGNKGHWEINPASQVATNANDQCDGHAYLDLYFQTHDKKMMVPTELALDDVIIGQDVLNLFNGGGGMMGGFGGFGAGGFGATTNPTGRRGPTTAPDANNAQRNPDGIEWWWSDALYMGPGVWARVSQATGNPKYLKYMNQQWWLTSDHLYDTAEHLYARDETFKPRHEANGKKMFWSRGNGWVMGGLVRVLQSMPADYPDRPRYVKQLQEMAARLIQIQGPDGLWHAGMLDPDSYDQPENSGSAFFVYAMAYGINQNILDAATFRPAVEKGWKGLISHVYANGRLGAIQQTGDGPAKFKASSSYVYGVGAFLMAGAQLNEMAGGVKN